MNQDKQLIALNRETNKEFCFKIADNNRFSYESKNIDTSIEQTEDGFSFISMNGKKYLIEIISCHQNEYELLINGISYNFSVETSFSLKRKKVLTSQASESTTIRLKAPMPGKILEVMVKNRRHGQGWRHIAHPRSYEDAERHTCQHERHNQKSGG